MIKKEDAVLLKMSIILTFLHLELESSTYFMNYVAYFAKILAFVYKNVTL